MVIKKSLKKTSTKKSSAPKKTLKPRSKKILPPSQLASASKVSGIISLFIGWIPFLGWLLIFFSVISGLIAIRDISEGKYSESSRKNARLGIILGVISLILIPVELIIFGFLVYFGIIYF